MAQAKAAIKAEESGLPAPLHRRPGPLPVCHPGAERTARCWPPTSCIRAATAERLLLFWRSTTPAICPDKSEDLRRLDHRARLVLGLFASKETIAASQVAAELGLSEHMARNLLGTWVKDGWRIVIDPSRRARSCSLSAKYRQYIGSLSAIDRAGEENEQ